MVPRQILSVLVFALPILIVAYGVLMGGYALTQALQDAIGAMILRYTAAGCLVLLVIDLLLLVGALGVNALVDSERRDDEP